MFFIYTNGGSDAVAWGVIVASVALALFATIGLLLLRKDAKIMKVDKAVRDAASAQRLAHLQSGDAVY